MAVLKKFRSRWWSQPEVALPAEKKEKPIAPAWSSRYDIRPLTISQLDECWRLDQRCFVDGEAYSRETFEYLLTAPEAVSYRATTSGGSMVGFVVGLVEPDHTGHITTVGVAPDHRRRRLAKRLMAEVEKGFRQRAVRIVRLEVRSHWRRSYPKWVWHQSTATVLLEGRRSSLTPAPTDYAAS